LGGYLYVKRSNIDCGQINIAVYGKTHGETMGSKGIPALLLTPSLALVNIEI